MMQYESCDRVVFSQGDMIDGRYRVERLLGEGSFGYVYKVSEGGKDYALKILKLWEVVNSEREKLIKRFEREYETGKIGSCYLVHACAKGMVKGNPYIVMEYCDGGDLVDAMRVKKIDMHGVAQDVLYGLRDLHREGKVHRDLKPENVLLRLDGSAVLTDFGIAGDQNNRITRRGIMGAPLEKFGTFAYMPPEQLNPPRNNNATVLFTTDIFSFGVMMYKMITNEFPFGKLEVASDLCSYTENASKGRWNRARFKQNALDWMSIIIEGCLEPNYKKRLQNVDEVLALIPTKYRRQYRQFEHKKVVQVCKGMSLRIMEGEEYGRNYSLENYLRQGKHIVRIGRGSSSAYNEIEIVERESSYVSRCHCTLEYNESWRKWLLRDGQYRNECEYARLSKEVYACGRCGKECNGDLAQSWRWQCSKNGTYVNSEDVDERGRYIEKGDIITIGDVKLKVEEN